MLCVFILKADMIGGGRSEAVLRLNYNRLVCVIVFRENRLH